VVFFYSYTADEGYRSAARRVTTANW